ncbi:MAG: hypothetical protein J6J64_07100 [Alistipes sp.]|nr:hypothetical protein [Alistipes sp.]
MKTKIQKFVLIVKVLGFVIAECLIIIAAIALALEMPPYAGILVSNILTFLLALAAASSFKQFSRYISEADIEASRKEQELNEQVKALQAERDELRAREPKEEKEEKDDKE